MRSLYVIAVLASAAVAAPAQAAWHKAESPHFVIYADDSERDVRKFAEMLERFHSAMAIVTERKDAAPSPSNRLVIFAVGNQSRIQNLIGDKSRTLAGFYIPRASGSRAFVPTVQLSGSQTDFSLTVLLHEYAHHFLISTDRYVMPRWWSEGAAEFFASAQFGRDGTVGIGRPATHRAGELSYAVDVTVEELLDHKRYEKQRSKHYDAFYGRSWALYHYLKFEDLEQKARKGQLRVYEGAIRAGKPDREAALAAFGDLKMLESDLDGYIRRRRMTYFHFTPEKIPAPSITVTALSAGEGAVMPLRIRSQLGVDREKALALVAEVREVAKRYPREPAVMAALAEAEYDAGEDDAAIAAADQSLALDPGQTNAYVQKGYALFRKADAATDKERAIAFQAAMKPFQALNAIENDHPLPLIYYYRSFAEQGREPTETARHALERASVLAPFDGGLAFQAAVMQAGEGKIAIARAGLEALAANPHGGSLAEAARKLAVEIAPLAEGTKWEGSPALAEIEAEVTDDGA